MPNKAHLRLWVDALRSPVYRQGTEVMRDGEGPGARHCCLGVAQEVAIRAGHVPTNPVNWGQTSSMETSIGAGFYGLELSPWGTYSVLLETGDTLNATRTQAAVLNDEKGWTFPMIADAIERTYDLLTYDEIFDENFAGETVTP